MLTLAKRIGWLIFTVLILIGLDRLINGRINDYAQEIIKQCGIAVILAVSLNIVNGLTGQFSIGHAGFMSIGAYTGASVTYFAVQKVTHGSAPGSGWMFLAMLCGGVTAAVFGLVVGVPSLRLRGDYLAIVTLGFGEIIRVLLDNSQEISPKLSYMGGATGFYGESGSYSVPHIANFFILLGTIVAIIALTRNLKFSSHGLAFMSVREDEIAADAMGVNTTEVKVTAFMLSAFFAGVGGALFAHSFAFQPKTFGFILSMNYVIMIVLGGTGSITGATLAAVVLQALPELLKPVQDRIHFTDEYRLVIYALLLVLMMILRPSGVFGMGELSFAGLGRFLRGRGLKVTTVAEGLTQEAGAAVADTSSEIEPAVDITYVRDHKQDQPNSAVVLDVDHVTRRFGGLTAVGDVSIKLRQGELVGLIGPNGAGKTTLFNLLTGVYTPSEGQLQFNGDHLAGDRALSTLQRGLYIGADTLLYAIGGWVVGTIVSSAVVPYAATPADISLHSLIKWLCVVLGVGPALAFSSKRHLYRPGYKPYQFAFRGISRTFQNIRLFGNLTVLENVRIGTFLRRRTNVFDALFRSPRLETEEAQSVEKAQALLSRFNLLRVQNEQAKNLPYGDQRRLEIVRALATDPKLLLLDEPAAGMNPQEKVALMHLIRKVRDEFGLTILLIEHDMKLVMGICERIYVLDYGRIIAEGTPQEIRSNPKVIAAYLGEEIVDA